MRTLTVTKLLLVAFDGRNLRRRHLALHLLTDGRIHHRLDQFMDTLPSRLANIDVIIHPDDATLDRRTEMHLVTTGRDHQRSINAEEANRQGTFLLITSVV